MLVYAETKTPVGKLPYRIGEFTILRYTTPTRVRPSGELILRNDRNRELMRAAPPVFGLMVTTP